MGEAYLNRATNAAAILPSLGSAVPKNTHFAWYVLKVRTGGEKAAVTALTYRGFDPYFPTQKKNRRYSDRIKVVDEAVFPGYVFCQFDAQLKLPIISSPGVEYILGAVDGPLAVPEEELTNIRRMIGAGATAASSLMPGQRVRVTHGPLEGVEGKLVRNDNGSRLVVSIELLKQGASLHIEESNLCLVDQCH